MVENLLEKALKAYEAIFGDRDTVEIEGNVHHLEHTSVQRLRTFSIGGYNYIEQNPDKERSWA
jgi:hypothetical protein